MKTSFVCLDDHKRVLALEAVQGVQSHLQVCGYDGAGYPQPAGVLPPRTLPRFSMQCGSTGACV